MDTVNLDSPLNVDLALVRLNSDIIDFKVGLFTSRSRLGRGLQSVGSYALPGDTTSLRHPVRSGAYQAATPGGSSTRGPRLGRRIGGERQFVRCPNGYEFGGRFAGRNFSNCGRRVFENPFEGVNSGVAGAVGRAAQQALSSNLPNAPRGSVREIVANNTTGRSIQIQRNAVIPEVGKRNTARLNAAISSAVTSVLGRSKNKDNRSMLVRRDGVLLSPTVSINELAKLKNNADMENGVLVSALRDPSSINSDAVRAFVSSNLDGIVFAIPNGAQLKVSKKRPLTPSEARRLTGVFNRAQAKNGSSSYDAGLAAMVEAANGALSYNGRFPGVSKPYERLTVENAQGDRRIVPRWIFEIFLSPSAPERGGRESWTRVQNTVIDTEKKSLDSVSARSENRQALIEFKTASFISSNDLAAYAFQVKRVAAVWDTDLPPSGGYRCPPGTRYGGRITDRFGRNCGWNVSRRLANQLENIGQNIGERLDDRRDRRVAGRLQRGERRVARAERRVERAQRRLEAARERIAGSPVAGRRGAAERVRAGLAERRMNRRNERIGNLENRDNKLPKLTTAEKENLVEMIDMLPKDDPRRQKAIDRLRADGFGPSEDRIDQVVSPIHKNETTERLKEMVGELDATNPNRASIINELKNRGEDPIPGWKPQGENLLEDLTPSRGERRRQRRGERADRMDRLADRVDYGYGRERDAARAAERAARRQQREERRRQRRGERADRMDRLADRVDYGYGRDRAAQRAAERAANRQQREERRRQRRGERADRLSRLADRIDGGYGREADAARAERRAARREQRRQARIERRQRRAERMDRAADRVDYGYGRRSDAARAETATQRSGRRTQEDRRRSGEGKVPQVSEKELNAVREKVGTAGLPERPFWRKGDDTPENREWAEKFDKYYDENGDLTAAGKSINKSIAQDRKAAEAERIATAPKPGEDDFSPTLPVEKKWDAAERSAELQRWREKNAHDEAKLQAEYNKVQETLAQDDISAEERSILEAHSAELSIRLSVLSRVTPEALADENEALEVRSAARDYFIRNHDDADALRAYAIDLERIKNNTDFGPETRDEARRQLSEFKERINQLDAVAEDERLRKLAVARDEVYQELYKENINDLNWLKRFRDTLARDRIRYESNPHFREVFDRQEQQVNDRIADLEARRVKAADRVAAETAAGIVDPFAGDAAQVLANRVAVNAEKRKKILDKYFRSRYGDSDAPWLDPSVNVNSLTDLVDRGDRAAVKDVMRKWFEHQEIPGADGWKFKTSDLNVSISSYDHTINVTGKISAFNKDTGNWEQVGRFERTINLEDKSIYNAFMAIGDEAGFSSNFATVSKEKGFSTTFNGHAWTWASNAGIEKVGVSAAWDGRYVWGKIGFRSKYDRDYRELATVYGNELRNFEAGRNSILNNEEDAAIIRHLIQKANDVNFDKNTAPGHADYLAALSNTETTPEARKAREADIKTWATRSIPFGSGTLDLTGDEGYFFRDPRAGGTAVPSPLARVETKSINGPQLDGLETPTYADLEKMTKIAGPIGSNGGQWYKDEVTGRIFLAKPARSQAHAENEVAMAAIYRAAGVKVPRVSLAKGADGKHYVVSEKLDIRGYESLTTEQLQERAREHMGIDLLLSNWDVFGTGGGDNVGISPSGEVVRVDVGGAGIFRARGDDRSGFSSGSPWVELSTMLTGEQGKALYGEVNNEQFSTMLDKVASLDVDKLVEAAGNAGVTDEVYLDRIRETLLSRQREARELNREFAGKYDEASRASEEDALKFAKTPVEHFIGDNGIPGVRPGKLPEPPPSPSVAPSTSSPADVKDLAAKAFAAPFWSTADSATLDVISQKYSEYIRDFGASDITRFIEENPEMKASRDAMIEALVEAGFTRTQARTAADAHSRLVLMRMTYIHNSRRSRGDAAIDAAFEAFKAEVASREARTGTTLEGFLGIIADERFKTQHETGTSMGALAPDHRRSVERDMFGMPVERPNEKSPYYGHLGRPGEMEDTAAHYGSYTFVLNDEAKSRTTVTGTDSLGAGYIPSPISDPSILSADVESRDGYSFYLETQTLGGLKLSDIKSVYLPAIFNPASPSYDPDFSSYSPTEKENALKVLAAIEKLKSMGIEIQYWPNAPRWGSDLR